MRSYNLVGSRCRLRCALARSSTRVLEHIKKFRPVAPEPVIL
jgi:hypothetical protein